MVRNAPFFKCVVLVLALLPKGHISGPSLSSSGGILGSFSESQLDILNDPAVKPLEAVLSVRDSGPSCPVPACPREHACSCVAPFSRRHSGNGNDGEFQLDRVARVFAGSRAHPSRCPPGCVSVAVPGDHSLGSNAVTVAVLGEHSRRSDGAAAGSSPRTIG